MLHCIQIEGDKLQWQMDVTQSCNRIPPLWDLQNYVAVNPFLAFSDQPLHEAATEIHCGTGGKVLPPIAYFRRRWRDRAFDDTDLRCAAQPLEFPVDRLREILDAGAECLSQHHVVLTVAESIDRAHRTDWHQFILRWTARWCAVYTTGGGSFWPTDESKQPLYQSWRKAAQIDRSFEIAGLNGWRRFIKELPDDPLDCIKSCLQQLQVSSINREWYLYRLLGGLYGWASYFRRDSWQQSDDSAGQLRELLAIRIASDAAVAVLTRTNIQSPVIATEISEDERVRSICQEAIEAGFVRQLASRIKPHHARLEPLRPALQAVFCIDVRSEPVRRHLESLSESIETRGFAGFFGVALDWNVDGRSSARCPVLLRPAIRLDSTNPQSELVGASLKLAQAAPAASFSFVEVLGAAYGLGLFRDDWLSQPRPLSSETCSTLAIEAGSDGVGISPSDRVELAVAMLTNMGLRTTFARIILLCGHESRSTNNPHAASLDCGACGGHSGAINARVAAAVLNDPEVRQELSQRGWAIPDDTHFLPAVHDTSNDHIHLLDLDRLPQSHENDLQTLKQWLADAGRNARIDRAPSLGLTNRSNELGPAFDRLARDWAQVRPEWGLARNAAFIAARRSRTRGVDLKGRVFLHEYDASIDPDGAILRLILSAPVVVASWINLQYYASTVDNRILGAGSKTLHNRVGNLGVVLGNGGDLRTGLAEQSVHQSEGSWFHEPLRLQVVVEAPTSKIDAVLNIENHVQQLAINRWISIYALEPDGSGVYRRTHSGTWEPLPPTNE